MRKAVYIAILLWFLRRTWRKLTRGSAGVFRLVSGLRPGDPGYDRERDTVDSRILFLWGPGWTWILPGTQRGDLCGRQWMAICDEVRRRYGGKLDAAARGGVDVMCYFLHGENYVEHQGRFPPDEVQEIGGEIEDFVRGLKP